MPEKTGIPSKEEIASLPRWACVAFAARCARRVQPLYGLWKDAPQKHVDAVDTAIDMTEQAAGEARVAADTAAHGAFAAARAAEAAVTDDASYSAAIVVVANAIYFAASAAAPKIDPSAPTPAVRVAVRVADTASSAAAAAAAGAGDRAQVATIVASRRDFELLKQAARSQGWTDEMPVPPEFFGPLWPDGEPPGWPSASKAKSDTPPDSNQPAIVVVWDPNLISEDDYAELMVALGDLVRSQGSVGIERIKSRGFGIPVGEEVVV